MKNEKSIPIIGVSDLRVESDGPGIRTLIISPECPLNCKYCINDFCHKCPDDKIMSYSVTSLYKKIKNRRIYYWASGGGVVFGGGEPLLHEDYILEFSQRYGREISITIETSLNVPIMHLEELKKTIDLFIVDIKDMNSEVYEHYTGMSNNLLIENLARIVDVENKVMIRIPLIKGFNEKKDQIKSRNLLKTMGFSRFDFLTYVVRGDSNGAEK